MTNNSTTRCLRFVPAILAFGIISSLGQAQPWSAVQVPLNVTLQGRVNAVAVSPDSDSRVAVVTESGGLYLSEDSGATFHRVPGAIPFEFFDVAWLRQFESSTPANVLLATTRRDFRLPNGGGLWRSVDRGATWRQVDLRSLAGLPPANDMDGYAISQDGRTGKVAVATDAGLALSGDRGATWRLVNPFGAPRSASCVAVAYASSSILVSGQEGMRWSTDDGRTWNTPRTSMAGSNENNYHGLNWGTKAGMAYYADWGGNLSYTTDYGQNWTMISPLPGLSSGPGGIRCVYEVTRGTTLELYFCNTYHAFRKTARADRRPEAIDLTGPWTELGSAHDDVRCMAFTQGNMPYFMGSDGGLHTTRDGGATWEAKVRPGLCALQVYDINGQWAGSGSDRRYDLYVGTQDNGFFASGDIGRTWPTAYGNEGFFLQMLPDAGTSAPVVIFGQIGSATTFRVSGRYFDGARDGTGAVNPVANDDPDLTVWGMQPTMLGSGRLVQGITVGSRVTSETLRTGLAVSDAARGTWTQLSVFPEGRGGLPLVSQNRAFTRIYQPYETGLDPDLNLPRRLLLSVTTSSASFGTAAPVYRRMGGFGSIGRTNFQFAWLPVIGVHPTDFLRLLASDIKTGGVSQTETGGNTWTIARSLTDLVLHGTQYRFAVDGDVSFVSAISYCPTDPSRILVGCRIGGVYLSTDGGVRWERIINSEWVTNVTSFHWKSNVDVYASSFGTGVWRLAPAVIVRPPVEPPARESSIDRVASEALDDPDTSSAGIEQGGGQGQATREDGLASPPFQGAKPLAFIGGKGDPAQPRLEAGSPIRVRLGGLSPRTPKELQVFLNRVRLPEKLFALDGRLNELRILASPIRGGNVVKVVWVQGLKRVESAGFFFYGGSERGPVFSSKGPVAGKVPGPGGVVRPVPRGGKVDVQPRPPLAGLHWTADDILRAGTATGGPLVRAELPGSAGKQGAPYALWRELEAGASLGLPFDLKSGGAFNLAISFVRSSAGGAVQMMMDGKEVGKAVDTFFSGSTVGKYLIGRVTLTPGHHQLTLKVIGGQKGQKRQVGILVVGLDAVKS